MVAMSVFESFSDVAFAARRLRRTPMFTAAAVMLLGVGMTIATAAASLVNVALFKRPAEERGLVHIAVHDFSTILPGDAVDAVLSAPPVSVRPLAGFGITRSAAVVADGVSTRAAIEAVTGPYFPLFAAVPRAGRLLDAAEARRDGTAMVAVISDRFWRRVFDERPDAIGSTLAVAGRTLTIVGVVNGPVRTGVSADVWVPSHVLPVEHLFGRLVDGATIEQATAEIAARYGPFDVGGAPSPPFVREGLRARLGDRAYAQLTWQFGLAVAISLIASVSFGLLLFARMAATQSDMAVRIALGATRHDLTRLLAFEVVLVALAATFVAMTGGSLLVHFVMSQYGDGWRVAIDASPDWRVFLFVAAITLTMALAVVARLGWSVAHVEALGSMVATGGIGGATIRTAGTSFRLVIAQTAATAALLLAAALIARSSLPDRAFTGGLDLDGAAIAWIDPTVRAGAAAAGVRDARVARDTAADLPGVREAAVMTSLPGSGTSTSPHAVHLRPDGNRRSARIHYVSAGAFDILGLRQMSGRAFTAREDEAAMAVAVVSRNAARRFWPGLDAVGQRLWLARDSSGIDRMEAVVIGVVSDVEARSESVTDEPRDVYLPFAHTPDRSPTALFVRGDEDAGALAERLREPLQQALPATGFLAVKSLAQDLADRAAPPPFVPRVIGVLGAIVFVVAVGGLYGLTSYLATMRGREMGIRKALGATTMRLCGMLAREHSFMLLSGVVIGIIGGLFAGSYFLTPGTSFRLFDPVAITSVAGFLYVAGLICAIAPFVPAMFERTVRLGR
jgi:predicted permease